MLVFDWKIEKGRRFRWAGCTPLKPAGRRRAFKPKKKGLNIIMKAKKTAKRKFTKRTAAAITIAMLVIAGCIGSASAAVESWTHTVSCAATGSTSFVFNANHYGTRTDTFSSYPTIYNGKSNSTAKCHVKQGSKVFNKQDYYLQGNSPSHPTYNFGKVPTGASVHYYDNTYGGFSSSVVTSQQY